MICPSGTFDCGGGRCIPSEQRCDCVRQCGNNADENNCGEYSNALIYSFIDSLIRVRPLSEATLNQTSVIRMHNIPYHTIESMLKICVIYLQVLVGQVLLLWTEIQKVLY